MTNITLVTGGARSGKSGQALRLAAAYDRPRFVATAEAFDAEMRDRIDRHRAERGAEWTTVECPHDPAAAIRQAEREADVVVLDCLTVWLGNLMHRDGDLRDDAPVIEALVGARGAAAVPVIVVSNELGMGLVPATPQARRFRDVAGRLNQRIAALASTVVLAVSGIPVVIKER